MKRSFLLLAGVAAICGALAAQEPSRGPDAGTSTHISGIVLLAIPGKPFSGIDNIEWTRTLADGSTIVTHTTAIVARDGQGRMYRENHHFVPLGRKSPLYEVHIYDPVSRSQMHCSTTRFQCIVTDYVPKRFFETTPAGTSADGTRTLARESLGSDTIAGIYVQGTRETTTIGPGVLGNDRPLVSTREFWYSEDLQTNLKVTRIDPHEGTQAIWISNLSPTEPDPHLFDVPIGYSVRDTRASARTRR